MIVQKFLDTRNSETFKKLSDQRPRIINFGTMKRCWVTEITTHDTLHVYSTTLKTRTRKPTSYCSLSGSPSFGKTKIWPYRSLVKWVPPLSLVCLYRIILEVIDIKIELTGNRPRVLTSVGEVPVPLFTISPFNLTF